MTRERPGSRAGKGQAPARAVSFPVEVWLRGAAGALGFARFAYTGGLRVRVPRMGMGGDKFRTWSGPGGSSHKGPLTSAHTYSGHFFMALRAAVAGAV